MFARCPITAASRPATWVDSLVAGAMPPALLSLAPLPERLQRRVQQQQQQQQQRRGGRWDAVLLHAVLSRVVAALVFPCYALFDLVANLLLGTAMLLRAAVATDAYIAGEAWLAAGRCARQMVFSARALVSVVVGWVVPDAITMHYIENKTTVLQRSLGKAYMTPHPVRRPKSIREVTEIVKQAVRERERRRKMNGNVGDGDDADEVDDTGPSIAIVGAGQSQGNQTHAVGIDDIRIDLSGLNAVNTPTLDEYDDDNDNSSGNRDEDRQRCRRRRQYTVWVGAGATWEQVQLRVNQHGLALQAMQASNIFSVGGSFAGSNCHGWDHHAGTLFNCVRAISLVDSRGDVRIVQRDAAYEEERQLFRAVCGGWGLLGCVVEVQLELVPNTPLLLCGASVPAGELHQYFDRLVRGKDCVALHLLRLSLQRDGSGRFWQEGPHDDTTAFLEYYVDPTAMDANMTTTSPLISDLETADSSKYPRGSVTERVALHLARNWEGLRAFFYHFERTTFRFSERIRKPENEKSWLDKLVSRYWTIDTSRNSVMGYPLLSMLGFNSFTSADWLQEFFVPREHLTPFIRFLGAVLGENNVALINASVRYIPPGDESIAGYAQGEEMFAVVLCFTQSLREDEVVRTRAWVLQVIDALHTRFDGRYYLSYQPFASREQFVKNMPRLCDLLRVKNRHDPHWVWNNAMAEQYGLREMAAELRVHDAQGTSADTGAGAQDSGPARQTGAIGNPFSARGRQKLRRSRFASSASSVNGDGKSVAPIRDAFHRVYSDPQTTAALGSFLCSVFRQVDPLALSVIVEELMAERAGEDSGTIDERFYRGLCAKLTKESTVPRKLAFLSHERDEFPRVVRRLFAGPGDVVMSGQYVEIGPPARNMQGMKTVGLVPAESRCVAVCGGKPAVTDFLQHGLVKPYHERLLFDDDFVPHLESLDRESVALLVFDAGLHHTRIDAVDGVIDEIYRILIPGGSFVLREHDAREDNDVFDLAFVVHVLANAVQEESWELERDELRAFVSLDEWVARVTSHGFVHIPPRKGGPAPMRDGDASANAFLRFMKPLVPTTTAATKEAKEELEEDDDVALERARELAMRISGYARPLLKTRSKAVEWHIVDAAGDAAELPAGSFDYWGHIATLWWLFFQALWGSYAGGTGSSIREIVLADEMVMNLFITPFQTILYFFEGLAFAPLAHFRPRVAASHAGGLPARKAEVDVDYSATLAYYEFICPDFFFNFPYFQHIPGLWRLDSIAKCARTAWRERNLLQALADLLVTVYLSFVTTTKFVAMGSMGMLVMLYHRLNSGGTNSDEDTSEPEDDDNGAGARTDVCADRANDVVMLLVRDPEDHLQDADTLRRLSATPIVPEATRTGASPYKIIQVPQEPLFHRELSNGVVFENYVARLVTEVPQVELVEIASQTTVDVKVRAPTSTAFDSFLPAGCRVAYHWPVINSHLMHRYVVSGTPHMSDFVLHVPVGELAGLIHAVQAQPPEAGVVIHMVFDF